MTPDQIDRLSAVWTVLARVLEQSPDESSLANLRSEEMLQEWPLTSDDASAGIDQLVISGRDGETVTEISDDHFYLFSGPGKTIAPPWESVYRSQEKLLFEEQTLQVRQFYRHFGLQAPHLNREPDDHIALELEFCAYLLVQALDAYDRDEPTVASDFVAAHRDFCVDHLFEWAGEFFTTVTTEAQTSFYTGIGILGVDALNQARAWQL